MVAELSALQQIIDALTGMNGLPAVIVECFVTTVYTCEYFIPLNQVYRLTGPKPLGVSVSRL